MHLARYERVRRIARMLGTDHIHSDKRTEGASSTSRNGTSPIEGLICGSRPDGLRKRLGNALTELETENLKVRAVLNDSGSL